jgi:DNA methylase
MHARSTAERASNHRRESRLSFDHRPQPIHQALHDTFLRVVIAVADAHPAGMPPDLGRQEQEAQPAGWQLGNRFKNAWEPVFHFCRQPQIKFRPEAVGHVSDDCFEYSPHNPKSRSGSGLLGCGDVREDGRFCGTARPSNVIEVRTECNQGSHSAPFPRALVEFFVKAFSDAGDIVYDPFLGSASTIAAAHLLGRVGYGSEISAAYCDVALRRIAHLIGEEPVLADTGQTMAAVAAERGVPLEQVANPRLRDARHIRHNGPAPFYGSRRKVGQRTSHRNG